MKTHLLRRTVTGLALATLALTGLTPAPAQAASYQAEVGAGINLGSSDEGCEWSGSNAGGFVPITDNGVPVSHSVSAAGTVTNEGDEADVTDLSGSSSVRASIAPIRAGKPAAITFAGTAKASVVPRAAASECDAYAEVSAGVRAAITLEQPTWVVIRGTGKGTNGTGQAVFYGGDGYGGVALGARGEGSSTALLPAGPVEMQILLVAQAGGDGDGDVILPGQAGVTAAEYSASYRIELLPMGHPLSQTGTAAPYVQIGARDCATGTVSAELTKKAKKKAERVVFKVNGDKVATFKDRKADGVKKLKKGSVALPAPAGKKTKVKAKVTLKNGRRSTITRVYLPCG